MAIGIIFPKMDISLKKVFTFLRDPL